MENTIKKYIDSKKIIDLDCLTCMFKLFGKNDVLKYFEKLVISDSFDFNKEEKYVGYFEYLINNEFAESSNANILNNYYNSVTYIDSVKEYLTNFSRFPVFSEEEEKKEAKVIYDGRIHKDGSSSLYLLKTVPVSKLFCTVGQKVDNKDDIYHRIIDFNTVYNTISKCEDIGDRNRLLKLVDEAKNKNGEDSIVRKYEKAKYDELKTKLNSVTITNGKTLTVEELEKQLKMIADYREAYNSMINHNLRLVVSIVKRYDCLGIPFLDLINEGNIGLMKAVEKYDVTKGFRFSTYATWWIRQAVTRAIANNGKMIRIPASMFECVNKVERIRKELVAKLNREPSVSEIAKELGILESQVVAAINYTSNVISLDTPVGDDEGITLVDFLVDENSEPSDAIFKAALTSDIASILDTLTEKEKLVIMYRYGFIDDITHTLEFVSKKLGITKDFARKTEISAIKKLRNPRLSQRLVDYHRN